MGQLLQSDQWNANILNARFTLGGGITGPDEMAWLVSSGTTHVISAAEELDDEALCVPVLVNFFHLKWQDDGQPKPIEDLLDLLDWTLEQDQEFMSGRDVLPSYYIHCAAGINRGPAVCTFLIAAHSGADATDVWDRIKAIRTQVNGYNVPAYKETVDAALNTIRTHIGSKDS